MPSQVAPAVMEQEPEHSAPHSPDSSPPSQLTSALPGSTLASHEAAQSAMALMDAPHFGGTTEREKLPPAFAFRSPMALAAASQADTASSPSTLAPRSLARLVHAPLSSASISAARAWSSTDAVNALLTLAAPSASKPNSFAKST